MENQITICHSPGWVPFIDNHQSAVIGPNGCIPHISKPAGSGKVPNSVFTLGLSSKFLVTEILSEALCKGSFSTSAQGGKTQLNSAVGHILTELHLAVAVMVHVKKK